MPRGTSARQRAQQKIFTAKVREAQAIFRKGGISLKGAIRKAWGK